MTTAIDNKHVNAEEVTTRRQQLMMKERLTQAFKKLKEGKTRPDEELFYERNPLHDGSLHQDCLYILIYIISLATMLPAMMRMM